MTNQRRLIDRAAPCSVTGSKSPLTLVPGDCPPRRRLSFTRRALQKTQRIGDHEK